MLILFKSRPAKDQQTAVVSEGNFGNCLRRCHPGKLWCGHTYRRHRQVLPRDLSKQLRSSEAKIQQLLNALNIKLDRFIDSLDETQKDSAHLAGQV